MTMTYDTVVASVLNQLAMNCYDYARGKGFWEDEDELLESQFPKKPELQQRIISLFNSEKIALEMSELAERLECLRKDPTKKDEHCPEFLNVEIEVADLIIRAMDFAGRRKLRIGDALVAKMKYNSTRSYKHGKNF